MPISRREFLLGASVFAIAGGLAARPFGLGLVDEALAQTVSSAELMAPGEMPDQALGPADAPVTIIEYASLTCPHCAQFATKTYPELKKRYIDTGKVRFIFRDFPLDQLAAAGAMLGRCAGDGKRLDLIEALFHQQSRWAVNSPLAPLLALAKQAGFTEQSFNACLSNQKLLDDLQKDRDRASKQFGVTSTPTFFINGQKFTGALSIEDMEKAIQPHLKS